MKIGRPLGTRSSTAQIHLRRDRPWSALAYATRRLNARAEIVGLRDTVVRVRDERTNAFSKKLSHLKAAVAHRAALVR